MLKVRVVKTGSSANAVQVVRYSSNKRIIVKHFGSCKNGPELDEMLLVATEWIKDNSGQLPVFKDGGTSNILHLDHTELVGAHSTFLFGLISKVQDQIGLHICKSSLLLDLVTIRIIKPASKLHSIELLETNFNIKHHRQSYYKLAPQWSELKEGVESTVVKFAQAHYGFGYDLLFYDVTTLYFEAFEGDTLRKQGFSKDNKPQQPQIVVALMVTREGFPVGYQVFPGNTFEGKTFIPSIQAFIKNQKVDHFTVIADAAMISATNVEELRKANIHYIVGARLGNAPNELADQIYKGIQKQDGKSIRIKTDNGYLICSYSSARYRKDKHEMKKQIAKAKQAIDKPSKRKKIKFTKISNEQAELNSDLIKRTIKLLGVKGYTTDLEETVVPNHIVMERYHELYRIEQAFRVSKSDLRTRPIFHFKEEPIKLHMLICFMALVTAKQIELKTGASIKRFMFECEKIKEAVLLNKITNKTIKLTSPLNPIVKGYLESLGIPH